MKRLSGIVVACMLVTTFLAHAQSGPARTLAAGQTVGPVAIEREVPLPNAKRVKYAWTLTLTGRSDGITLAIDGGAISTTITEGTTGTIASATAAEIFDLAAMQSVAGAIELGYLTPGSTAIVTHGSCATRSGDGFVAGGATITRTYSTSTTIIGSAALVSVAGTTDCTAPAEATIRNADPTMR